MTSLWEFCAPLTLVIILALAPAGYGNAEVDALNALKNSLSDPNNALGSWDSTSADPCSWIHITCNEDNKVIRVDLQGLNLSGHLVPELGQLQSLQYLAIFQNKIEGSIPVELGNLKSLISLELYQNKLSGTIPHSFGNLKSLNFLLVYKNQLIGHIPSEIVDIPNLRVLDVSSNDLCGNLPPGLGRIPVVRLEFNPRLGHYLPGCP